VKQLGDDVKRQLARFGPQAEMPRLVDEWPGVVGETIARNAWPARVARDGTLHVNTADSVWAFELTSRAADVARRLGVSHIRFAPGPLPEPAVGPVEEAEIAVREPSEDAQAEGERLAAEIGDEKLRKVVARAAALSLETAAADRSVW
jgi:Dna[CI] antecedent, DciA